MVFVLVTAAGCVSSTASAADVDQVVAGYGDSLSEIAADQDESFGEVTEASVAPTFAGGVVADGMPDTVVRSGEAFTFRREFASRIQSPSRMNGAWTFSFPEGAVVATLVGRSQSPDTDVSDNDLLIEDVLPDGTDQFVSVSPYGGEDFLLADSNDHPLGAAFSWDIDLPSGWSMILQDGMLFIRDRDDHNRMRVKADYAISQESGAHFPTVSSLEGNRLSISAYPQTWGVGGEFAVDPAWTVGSGGAYSKQWCEPDLGSGCYISSSSQVAGWSKVDSGASYNGIVAVSPAYGLFVGAAANQTISNSDAGLAKYSREGNTLINEIHYRGQQTGTNFACRAKWEKYTTGTQGTGASDTGTIDQTINYQNVGITSPVNYRFHWVGFELKTVSGSQSSGTVNNGKRCDLNRSGTNGMIDLELYDAATPTIPDSISGISSTTWYNNSTSTLSIGAGSPSDLGSGLYDRRLYSGKNILVYPSNGQSASDGVCVAPVAANTTPCSVGAISGLPDMGFAPGNTNSNEGTNTLTFEVEDFAGNENTTAKTITYKFDSVKPMSPIWVSDGDLEADLDGAPSSSQLQATWSAMTEPGTGGAASGVDNYQICISTVLATSGRDCAGSPVQTWVSVGNQTTFTKTGLSLGSGTYYSCVRAVDRAANVSVGTCSDGQLVDSTAPSSPTVVIDGQNLVDSDWVSSPENLPFTWSAATDAAPSSGIVGYEVCATSANAGADCAAGALSTWEPVGDVQVGQIQGVTSTPTTIYLCVRAVDAASNYSGASCTDGQQFDATLPSVPATIADGTASDIDRFESSNEYSGNWSTATDGQSGIDVYRYCITAEADGADCADVSTSVWQTTSSTSATVSSLHLDPDSEYYICVSAVDRASNSSGFQCSDGATLLGVSDGSVTTDESWNTSSSSIMAHWTTPLTVAQSGEVASSQACVTVTVDGADCGSTALLQWTATTQTTSTTHSVTLTEGAEYFVCIREKNSGGDVLSSRCSNGQTVDSESPDAPTAVRDGLTATDESTTANSFTISANWNPVADATGSGLDEYQYAIVNGSSTECQSAIWKSNDLSSALTETNTFTYSAIHHVCIRAVDAAGNTSESAVSNGQLVQPSTQEITDAQLDRLELGLPDSTAVVQRFFEQPAEDDVIAYGTLMTTSEQAAIDTREAAATTTLLAAEAYGATEPVEYGGSYTDSTTGEVHAKFTANSATHETNICATLSDCSNLVVEPAITSLGDLESKQEDLFDQSESMTGNDIEISSTAVDIEDNAIEVGSVTGNSVVDAEGRTVEDAIESAEGFEDTISTVVTEALPTNEDDQDSEAATRKRIPLSRANYFSRRGFAAGTRVQADIGDGEGGYLPFECTSNVNATKGSKEFILLADHCVDFGRGTMQNDGYTSLGLWSSWADVNNDHPSINRDMISYSEPKYLGHAHKGNDNWDIAAIPNNSMEAPTNLLVLHELGSTSNIKTRTIESVAKPKLGKKRACISTPSTEETYTAGYRCGRIKKFGSYFMKVGGKPMKFRGFKVTGVKTCHGDSGGPIFLDHKIIGVLSGSHSTANCSSSTWMAPMKDYVDAYDLDIVVD